MWKNTGGKRKEAVVRVRDLLSGMVAFFSEGYNGATSASTCRERRVCSDIHTSRVQFSFRHMQRCGRSVLAYAQMHSELQTS